ncbi:MAG TPA: ABC transporter ATP-binding protein [Candidatus Acidoferrum sp.]|nr:ABC transporter ATP-binding protein [Candidatus Acidoferrum sp.]
MLALDAIVAGYGSASALRGIDLHVAAGETVALVGANGAGKSTLLKTISGLVRPTSGRMTFTDRSLDVIPASKRVAAGIAHVPEGREIFGSLTVEENLRMGAYGVRREVDGREIERRIGEVVERFPVLRQRLDQPAGDLSGGQQQMLAIARGLMAKPRLLLLDEPSLGLAPALVDEIFRIVRDLRSTGVAVLIAEQNARATLAIAHRGYVLENGRIAAEGSAADLLAAPEIVERYLGVGETNLALRGGSRTATLARRLTEILGAAAGR